MPSGAALPAGSRQTAAGGDGRSRDSVDPSDPVFTANPDRLRQQVAELKARVEQAREGGGANTCSVTANRASFPVRERIDRLLDAGSPFLELSPLAALELYHGDAPGRRDRDAASAACQAAR